MLVLYSFIGGLVLLALLSWVLVRYGKALEKAESNDEKLEKVLEMHDVEKDIEKKPAPNSFDDIVDRL